MGPHTAVWASGSLRVVGRNAAAPRASQPPDAPRVPVSAESRFQREARLLVS